MIGKHFEDFRVGEKWTSSGRTVTQADILNFAGFSGDFNPLHVNEEFARKTMYKGTVASTPLVFALMSGMFSQLGFLDGTGRGWIDLQYAKVHRYVHPGETLHLDVEVLKKSARGPWPDVGVITWREIMLNQRGEVVIEQKRRTMVVKRSSKA